MSRREILATRYGEMLDMIACLSIDRGDMVPKRKPRPMDFDTFLSLR